MSRELRFWRNVILIGVVHLVLLIGLARWGGAKKPPRKDIVWMAAAAGLSSSAEPTPEPVVEEPTPVEEEAASPPPEETPAPAATPVESEIPLATPSATPPPTPTPKPSAEPKPTAQPKPKASKAPKRSPTPKPKATPKKIKKETNKKATPKPSATAAKKPSATPKKEKASVAVDAPKPGAGGTTADGRGAARAAEFNAFGNMLHDRFFGAWVQPRTASATGGTMSALVQLRIEKDGRVSDFKIVRSSGNVVVDESVTAVGRRVTKVDPLPPGLAESGQYDVRIKFELDVE
ncbi:MAG: TonB family protein [Chthoniobacterales bacterium]